MVATATKSKRGRTHKQASPKRPTRRKAPASKPAVAARPVPFGRSLMAGSYESGLPFSIHTEPLVLVSLSEEQFDFDRYDLSEEQARVADAALEAGCKISIEVSAEHALYAALRVAQGLKRRVFGAFDPDHGRLVLWDVTPECHEEA